MAGDLIRCFGSTEELTLPVDGTIPPHRVEVFLTILAGATAERTGLGTRLGEVTGDD